MIELDKKEYPKAIETLQKVQINNLFARAVIENYVSGKVYVDNTDNPTTFYIVHPYGMSLLLGNHNNDDFNEAFKTHALNMNNTRKKHEWMQTYPYDWDAELHKLFNNSLIKSTDNTTRQTKNIIELNTRINFKFNPDKYSELKERIRTPEGVTIKTTEKEFTAMRGTVVPVYFWDNVSDFLEHGIGFSTYSGNELACTAFSSYIMDNYLELGMETIPKFRGQGYARYTCTVLIDYCLENGYEPVWACRLENKDSYRLAKSLGFEESIIIPYYRLSN